MANEKEFEHFGKIRVPTGIGGMRIVPKEEPAFEPVPTPVPNTGQDFKVEQHRQDVVAPFHEPENIQVVLEKIDSYPKPPLPPNTEVLPFSTELERTLPERQ